MVDAKPFTSQSPAATAPLKGEQNALRADDLSVTDIARDSSPYPRGAKALRAGVRVEPWWCLLFVTLDLSVSYADSSPYPRGAKAQSVPFFAPLPGELARVKRESER